MKSNQIIILLVLGILILIGAIIFFVTRPSGPAAGGENETKPVQTANQPAVVSIKTVKVTENGFEPNNITVKVGEYVTFVNESGDEASVNSTPHPTHEDFRFLNLGQFDDGSSVQAYMETAGTFTYHNHFKPEQTGTITAE